MMKYHLNSEVRRCCDVAESLPGQSEQQICGIIIKSLHYLQFRQKSLHVPSDIDIDFLMIFKNIGNRKSRRSFLVVQFLHLSIKHLPYSKFCMISFSDCKYTGFGRLEGHFFHTYNDILTCHQLFTQILVLF